MLPWNVIVQVPDGAREGPQVVLSNRVVGFAAKFSAAVVAEVLVIVTTPVEPGEPASRVNLVGEIEITTGFTVTVSTVALVALGVTL
ncbi:hypothetical protein B6N58_00245 [Legionella micdadei]|nr:hypothetical protein B6N58_00245 [Legionella micdadei]